MNLQEIENLAIKKAVQAVHGSRGNVGLGSVATGATLPRARQIIPIDPETGLPVEDDPDTNGPFLAGDVVGVKAVG